MSDFLDRLIGRSFGLSPVVRPRLPSLFEPPSADAAIQSGQAPTAAEPTTTSEPRAAAFDAHAPSELTDAAPPRLQTSPPDFAPPFTDEPATQPLTRGVQTATNAPTRIESNDNAPPESHHPAGASPAQSGRRETQTPEPPPFPLTPPPRFAPRDEVDNVARDFAPPRADADGRGTTVIHLTQPEPVGAPPKSFEPTTRREAVAHDGSNTAGQLSELGQQLEGLRQRVERMQFRPAASEVRVETRPVEGEKIVERVEQAPALPPLRPPAPAPAEQRPARAQTQAPVFVRPRATQRAAPAPQAHEQADARAEEPTINVTIGRIEVRAAQTAEAPARQEGREQAPAAMSLREYLRKRSGGHSR